MLPNFDLSREHSLWFTSLQFTLLVCLSLLSLQDYQWSEKFQVNSSGSGVVCMRSQESYIFILFPSVLSLFWQETSSTCLALSTSGPEALCSEDQGLARATTLHARGKEVSCGSCNLVVSLSDLNRGSHRLLICKERGSCSSFVVTYLLRVLEYKFLSPLPATALEGAVNMFLCLNISHYND